MIQTSKINHQGEDRLKLVFVYNDFVQGPTFITEQIDRPRPEHKLPNLAEQGGRCSYTSGITESQTPYDVKLDLCLWSSTGRVVESQT